MLPLRGSGRPGQIETILAVSSQTHAPTNGFRLTTGSSQARAPIAVTSSTQQRKPIFRGDNAVIVEPGSTACESRASGTWMFPCPIADEP